jgi:hypothetical protein
MGDLHRDLLVLAQQHRRAVAAVIDERIVQPAIARARIERDIGKAELLDQVDDHVGLPAPLRVGFRRRAAGSGGGLVHGQSPGGSAGGRCRLLPRGSRGVEGLVGSATFLAGCRRAVAVVVTPTFARKARGPRRWSSDAGAPDFG